MQMLRALPFAFLCLSPFSSWCQPFSCGTDPIWQQQLAQDPVLKKRHETLENKRVDYLRSSPESGAQAIYTLPVVVHIIHQNGAENISDAQVVQGMQHLNAAFANSGYYDGGNGVVTPFQFCLARRAPDGSPTSGINRVVSPLTNLIKETQDLAMKNLSRWDPSQYVNIWLVGEISSLGSGSGVAGYAYLPAAHGSPVDGLVMEARWFGSTPANSAITVHEMGHYLGLYHSFQGGCLNDDCTLDGDRVCDTPPDQSTAWLPCGVTQNSCSTDTDSGFATDQNDMTINYMDYATLSCYSAFTTGQSDRMAYFLLETRASLLGSPGCLDPCLLPPVMAAFTVSAGPTVPVGSTVNFTNTSVNAANYQWLIDGVPFATTQHAGYTFNTPGEFSINLLATADDPNCFDSYTFSIKVVCNLNAGFTIDLPEPKPGATITCTSTDTAATQYDWTVNGLSLSTTPEFVLTIPEPGNYSICLTVANAFCLATSCQMFFVEDTLPCPSSFVQEYRLGSGERHHWIELEALSGGTLLAGGNMDNWAECLAQLNPKNGGVLQTWSLEEQPISQHSIIELAPDSENNALGLLSIPEYSGLPSLGVFKFDPNQGKVVWSKRLDYPDEVSARLALEHPTTKEFWVIGVIKQPSQQTDETFLYRIDPLSGDVVSQKNYSNAEFPYGLAAVAYGDRIFVAGYVKPDNSGQGRYAAACLGPDGSVLWSKQFNWPGVWGALCDIKLDGDALVFAGFYGFNRMVVLKTDLNGQEIWTRWLNSSIIHTHHASSEPFKLIVLPDGYLLVSHQGSTINEPKFIFSRLDKQGNYLGTKMLPLQGNYAGIDALQNDEYLYAVTGAFFSENRSVLMRLDLDFDFPALCGMLDTSILTPLNSSTQVVNLAPALRPVQPLQIQPYPLTLTAKAAEKNRLCEAVHCNEFCDNGLDDDGDGYVDCFDAEDCPCQTDLPDCYTTDTLSKGFTGRLAWKSEALNVNTISTPIVANLNPDTDSIPEIIVFQGEPGTNNDLSNTLLIFRGDGANSAAPDILTIPGSALIRPVNFPVVGDVNNDGIPELVVACADRLIRIFSQFQPGASPPMTLWATSNQTIDDLAQRPYLADFNEDGVPEIYAGTQVFQFDLSNPASPQLNRVSGPNQNPYGRLNTTVTTQFTCSPVAADLLRPIDCGGDPDCDGLEIAAGNVIYSVDLNVLDGDPVQIKPQLNLNDLVPNQFFSDGYTSVADIDLDGMLDVLVAGRRGNQHGVYAWNKTGLVHFFQYPFNSTRGGGLVSVANVYDDKLNGGAQDFPELLTTCANHLICFNLNRANQNNLEPWWWTENSADLSGSLSVATFDFNNDRRPEILFRDQNGLRVMYGGPAPYPPGVDGARNWMQFPLGTGTIDEYPVMADLDNDGQAEMAITGHANPGVPTAGASSGRLWTFEADQPAGSPWLSARPLWHQFSYFILNANDDLTIPKNQQSPHLELPGLGSGKRPFNQFLAQQPFLDGDFNPYIPLPDATVNLEEPACAGDSIFLKLTICNIGDASLPAGTPLRIYQGAPALPGSIRLALEPALPAALPANQCTGLNLAIPAVFDAEIVVVINDDGSLPVPFQLATDFPVTGILECDYSNNRAASSTAPLPVLDLGPDVEVCQNGVWTFDAGGAFFAYQWSTFSTEPAITVYEPGKYWLEARDWCGRIHSDTVTVTIDSSTVLELGADTVLCAGSGLQFNVPGFSEYKWTPATALSCSDCADPVATPGAAVTYQLLAKTALGCYSADSIRVEIGAPIFAQIDTSLCPGASLWWNGLEVPAGSTQTFTTLSASGCDSTVAIQVGVLPAFQTAENLILCNGDSAIVFGNWVKQAGVFQQNFTAQNGCDSLHQISVAVLPTAQSAENLILCNGDSALVFGNWVKQPGVFQQNFTAHNGCDSLHQISVAVLPTAQTEESMTICNGDSALVFGNWVKQPGVFQQNFTAHNGCDSLHQISVAVLPSAQTEESMTICNGDSALVFGNWVKQAGVFQQNFTAHNGCDSLHQISVAVLPSTLSAENLILCNGDSALVFGNWVNQPGVFQQNFTAQNGCDSLHQISVAVLPSTLSAENLILCNGDSALVFGNWVNQPGMFQQNFTAQNGCDSLHQITVTVRQFPALSLKWRDPGCFDDNDGFIEITNAPPGYSYSLNGMPFQTAPEFEGLAAGAYSVQIRDNLGCLKTETVILEQALPPTLHMPADATIILGQSIQLAPQVGGDIAVYQWSPAEGLICTACLSPLAQPLETTTYTLTIRDANGCSETGQTTVWVRDVAVYIPNVFNPQKQIFGVFGSAGVRQVVYMEIYDRWGGHVFRKENFSADGLSGWDGTWRGEDCPPAVYVYVAAVELEDGQQVKFSGDVTLIR